MPDLVNTQIASRLVEVARLLRDQGADRFRANAYLSAADTIRGWSEPLVQVFSGRGLPGLEFLPGVGPVIAPAIRELILRGRLPMLDRLRGAADPVDVLASVPGIGRRLAERLHDELGLDSLEGLETAAHDGWLATVPGFGDKRLAVIRDSLASRLGRVRPATGPAAGTPPVGELLDVDREYREKARAGELPFITPRRFNPAREPWLPVLHTSRGDRGYTAHFSNTAKAHRLGKTRDWVVLYVDEGPDEHQFTVITAGRGPREGQRVVAGRDPESAPRSITAA